MSNNLVQISYQIYVFGTDTELLIAFSTDQATSTTHTDLFFLTIENLKTDTVCKKLLPLILKIHFTFFIMPH